MVTFHGEEVALAKLADKLGIPRPTMYVRWKEAGKPQKVDDAIVGRFHLLPDDTWYAGTALAKMFGLHPDTFNRIKRARGQIEFTREEIEKITSGQLTTRGKRKGDLAPNWGAFDPEESAIDRVEYHPTALARSLAAL